MFSESLANILGNEEAIELVGQWELNEQMVSRLIKMPDAPDVIIIAEEENMSIVSTAIEILSQWSDTSIIHTGLSRKMMRVYASYTFPARSADLMNVINNLPFQHHTGAGEEQT